MDKCALHVHSYSTNDSLQTTAHLVISQSSIYCLRHLMTYRNTFPHRCLFISDGVFKQQNYPPNLDTAFHSLTHEPCMLHFAQMRFDTITGITIRCMLLFHSTLKVITLRSLLHLCLSKSCSTHCAGRQRKPSKGGRGPCIPGFHHSGN